MSESRHVSGTSHVWKLSTISPADNSDSSLSPRTLAHIKHRRYWKVRCTLCGGDKVIAAQNLLCGRSKSCGCVARAKARERMTLLMIVEKFAAFKAQGMTEAEARAAMKRAYDQAVCSKTGES